MAIAPISTHTTFSLNPIDARSGQSAGPSGIAGGAGRSESFSEELQKASRIVTQPSLAQTAPPDGTNLISQSSKQIEQLSRISSEFDPLRAENRFRLGSLFDERA